MKKIYPSYAAKNEYTRWMLYTLLPGINILVTIPFWETVLANADYHWLISASSGVAGFLLLFTPSCYYDNARESYTSMVISVVAAAVLPASYVNGSIGMPTIGIVSVLLAGISVIIYKNANEFN
jgi:hypothetical protein